MRKFLAAAAALAAILTFTPTVHAERDEHEVTITGDVSCADEHGDYTVDWTLTSDDDGGGDTWSIGGAWQDVALPFHVHEAHNLSEGPGVEFETLFMWSNGEEIGRSGKLPAGEPCVYDSIADTLPDTIPATDAPTTVPQTTPPVTIGEIPGPASPGTTVVRVTTTAPTTSVVADDIGRGSTTTLAPGVDLPKTGSSTDNAWVAVILILVGTFVLLASRGPRRRAR